MIVLRCGRGRDDGRRGGDRVGKEQRPGRQGKRGRRSPLPTGVLQGFATPRTTRFSLPLGVLNVIRYNQTLPIPSLSISLPFSYRFLFLSPTLDSRGSRLPSATTLRFLDLVLGQGVRLRSFSSSPRTTLDALSANTSIPMLRLWDFGLLT